MIELGRDAAPAACTRQIGSDAMIGCGSFFSLSQWLYSSLVIIALTVPMLAGDARGNDSVVMQQITDMRAEASLSRERKLVMVLEFSSKDCGYCRKLEDLFLLPMQRNADYADKILIRSISLDKFETVIDFDGQRISTGEFANRYGVSLTPTLLFLNADGIELSERLIGIWSEDFYGAFIDNRIDEARQRL